MSDLKFDWSKKNMTGQKIFDRSLTGTGAKWTYVLKRVKWGESPGRPGNLSPMSDSQKSLVPKGFSPFVVPQDNPFVVWQHKPKTL
jgi:hypothetical protein